MTDKNMMKNEKFDFNEKINTVSLAKYFKYLYNYKFSFQDNIMYHFNGVYWKGESKKFILSTFNIFLANEFYNKLTKEFEIYKESKLNEAKLINCDNYYKRETKLIKLRKQLEDLVNSDRRRKIVKECLNYLTN